MGNRQEIRYLLEVPGNQTPSAKSTFTETKRRYRIPSRNITLIDAFLKKGINIDVRWNTYTALTVAASIAHSKLVSALLARDANVNATGFDKATPLIACAKFGLEYSEEPYRKLAMEVAKVLVRHGADLNRTDLFRKTALCYAFESNWCSLARFLISKGATIRQSRDNMSLFWAVSHPGTCLLKLFAKNGGKLNRKMTDGKTPLKIAEEAGWNDKARLIRKSLKSNSA